MPNYYFNTDVEYNVTPASSQGGGLLKQDTTYEFVDSLPTGSAIRQDRFYKINGDDGLYWYTGTMWVDLTDTVIKSGIVEVPTLPTIDIQSDILYRETGNSVIWWYDPVNLTWIDVSTNHVQQVNAIMAVTNPSHTILYQESGTNCLYWYNNDNQWVDVAHDNGIDIVSSLPTAPVSDKLYFISPSTNPTLYWWSGTEWVDVSTNFGVVYVSTKPTTGMRSTCLYYAADDTDSLWWYNGTSWLDLAEKAGIVIWTETYPPYEMTGTPSDTLIYNWLSDNSLWWYDSHGSVWVDIAKDTAIKIVASLTDATKRQDMLYKVATEEAIYWWNGSKWYDIYKNRGILEVASYPTSNIRSDCIYKLENDTDLMWWDGNKWVNISTDNGIIKATALPDTTAASHTNLYWVNDGTTNDNKLYWLDYANNWRDLAEDNSIHFVDVLPTTSDGKNLYRLSTDNHLYYYTTEWVAISDNCGINVVTALPTTLNAKQDRLYKVATGNKLYWYNGSQWKIVSDNGGMVEVQTLPTAPSDTSVLYRLTQDQYESGALKYEAWVYAWINGQWEEMKGSGVEGDRGISKVNGKIGHSNSEVTAVTTEAIASIAHDKYGHITESTQKALGRGISDESDVIGHSNTAISAVTTEAIASLAYNEYGHITSSTKKTLGRGLNDQSNILGHSNPEITAATDEGAYKIKFDKYGHIVSYTAMTGEDWNFTLSDGSTISKKVWIS